MKNLLIFVLFVFFAFTVVNNFPPLAYEIKQRSERAVAMPFRYAELYVREPEAKINIPIRKVKVNQIADTFGAPRGVDRQHKGQDIFAPRNTPVYSATGGYVWRIGENNLGGNTVWILGAGARVYYYAHLEKYAEDLKVGDKVSTETIWATSERAAMRREHRRICISAFIRRLAR